jgi:hypothetical protein
VDVGYVNGELFLNTSSVGAYTRYVRTREVLEPTLGYWLGSAVAGLRMLITLQHIPVILAAGGASRTYEAPFVFVGVQHRKLEPPGVGQRVPGGARALHVVVPRGRRQARRRGGGAATAFAVGRSWPARIILTLEATAALSWS